MFQDVVGQTLDECKSNYIDIPEHESERYGKHFTALMSIIFGILRSQSAQLDILIDEYSLEGSVGDKVKIVKPNEFDLVFKLQVPYYESIAVTRDPNIPGNVLLDMTRVLELLKNDPREDYQGIRKLLQTQLVDAQNFLVVDKLRSWLQSLFSQALNLIADRVELADGVVSQLKYRTCGPAHTIVVYGDYEYSVDFVPAIRLAAKQNVLLMEQLMYYVRPDLLYWEAIPKPLKIKTETSCISFRSSFYSAEKLMLLGKHENCRDAIRQVRDSYWEKPLSDILADMFGDLAQYLTRGVLPFFWDPELNMLHDLTKVQVNEMYKCVQRFLAVLRGDGIRQNHTSRRLVLRGFSHKNERNVERNGIKGSTGSITGRFPSYKCPRGKKTWKKAT